MKLKIDIDDKELIGLVKEQGYKKIRFSVEQQMHRAVRIAIENVVSEKDFKIMFKEALVEVLKTFQIRDLKGQDMKSSTH